jgi:purine-binding chemotaxis protein CheW
MEQQLVIFDLAQESFGVDISSVESIIKMQAITKIPHAPGFVEGITNLRGKVLPVIDLRKRFGLPGREPDNNSRIIIILINDTQMGMVVDGVSEVLTIMDENIEPTPPMVSTVDSAFITGIAKLEGRLVILLDLARVLSTQEQSSLRALPSAV